MRGMKTTRLLPVRTSDGRLHYASYADDAEKQRIIAWAKANNATVQAEPAPETSSLRGL